MPCSVSTDVFTLETLDHFLPGNYVAILFRQQAGGSVQASQPAHYDGAQSGRPSSSSSLNLKQDRHSKSTESSPTLYLPCVCVRRRSEQHVSPPKLRN